MASNYYFRDRVRVSREALTAFAWSAPMRDLAARVGLSDVGLRKLLVGLEIVVPPQGHWNRVHAGRDVPGPPPVRSRRPGEDLLLHLDDRFAPVLGCEPLPDPDGPFASEFVPEELDELRALTAARVGRVGRRTSLKPLHPALAVLLASEGRRRERAARDPHPWSGSGPLFDNPVDQRRLRLLNALFLALRRREVGASAYARGTEIVATAVVGSTEVSIDIEPVGRRVERNRWTYARARGELPASAPLVLTVGGGASWTDVEGSSVEARLAEVVVEVIVAGEAGYRRSLRVERERLEAAIRADEERRRARLAKANEDRLAALMRSAELLRQARDLRALVAEVAAAVKDGRHDLGDAELRSWAAWAGAVADGVDPVLSGQVLDHLRAPDVD